MKCLHPNFQTDVKVHRLTGHKTDQVWAYSACVKIRCENCGQEFAFLGMPSGLDPEKPTLSYTRDEARLPIVPYGDPNSTSPAAIWRRRAAYQGIYDPTEPTPEPQVKCGGCERVVPQEWATWIEPEEGDEFAGHWLCQACEAEE